MSRSTGSAWITSPRELGLRMSSFTPVVSGGRWRYFP
jgi:hypothetical protein